MGKFFKLAKERKYTGSRLATGTIGIMSLGISRSMASRAMQGRKNIGYKSWLPDEVDVLKKIRKSSSKKTYPISRALSNPLVYGTLIALPLAKTHGVTGSVAGFISGAGISVISRMIEARSYKGKATQKSLWGTMTSIDLQIAKQLKGKKFKEHSPADKNKNIALGTAAFTAIFAPQTIDVNRLIKGTGMVGSASTAGRITKKLSIPSFISTWKGGHQKFAANLTQIVAKLPKRIIGADPEVLGGKWFQSKGIWRRNNRVKIYDVGATIKEKIFGKDLPKGLKRDLSAPGMEFNPAPSHSAKIVTTNLKRLVGKSYKRMRKNEHLFNVAAAGRTSGIMLKNKKTIVGRATAGGHIHLNVNKGEKTSVVAARGIAGSLLPHYVVPGANLRVRGNYGHELFDTRSWQEGVVEIRHAPTWMHSPELAQKTLETTQLTAGHPEIKGMAAKFVKELAEDTQGKTINLYTPKIHKKVMNFYDKIYTKAGVTGDPALSKIFNRAGSYRPYKVGPIKDNWKIK